jgi:glycerol-3-phosphate dehydrogenase
LGGGKQSGSLKGKRKEARVLALAGEVEVSAEQVRLDRDEQVDSLANREFDVLVVGGGITGAGVALDAVARGMRVGLVEARDFASGTSSKSTKLVHGGIRYLPQLDIALVREALTERGILIRNAPYLVEPLPFVLPLYKENRHPLGLGFAPPPGIGMSLFLRAGLTAYDVLAGGRNVPRHRGLSKGEVAQLAPYLRRDGLIASFVYYDARTNDARLTLNVLITAATRGAAIANYCEVVGFERRDGRLAAAQVRDTLGGREFTIRARVFVNATGVYGEQMEGLTGHPSEVTIAPSKGVHLVLPRHVVGVGDHAITFPETADRRVLFIVPWGPRALLGTTDTGMGPLDRPRAEDEDVDYLLYYANRYLTKEIGRADVISAYAGYRPLIRRRDAASTAALSRSHTILDHPIGLVSVLGGKLTTYRKMGEETVDRVAGHLGLPRRHVTANLPLVGTEDLREGMPSLQRAADDLGLSGSMPSLIEAYGANAGSVMSLVRDNPGLGQRLADDLPYLLAQVTHACRYELAQTLKDALERRTWTLMGDWDHGLARLESVADLMAGELGWSPERRRREIEDYRAYVYEQFGSGHGFAEDLKQAA